MSCIFNIGFKSESTAFNGVLNKVMNSTVTERNATVISTAVNTQRHVLGIIYINKLHESIRFKSETITRNT